MPRFGSVHDGSDVERRRAPRVAVNTTAVVLARNNDGVPFTIESLSTSGARLAGPLTLDRGEHVALMFEAGGHPVDVRGEVVRVERRTMFEDGVAIRFLDLTPEALEAIRKLVSDLLDLQEDQGDQQAT